MKLQLKNALSSNPARSLFSGILLSLSYTIQPLWFLVFFALIPLLTALFRTTSLKESVLLSSYTFLIYYGTVFFFIFSAHPISWLGERGGDISLFLLFLSWIINSIVFSLPKVLWALFMKKVRGNIFAGVTGFIASEWLGALLFSLVWWNKEATIGSDWTYGFLGYSLAEFPPLLVFSSFGGVYFLSAIVIFLTISLYTSWQLKSFRLLKGVLITLLILTLAGTAFVAFRESGTSKKETVSIAAIHTNLEPQFFISEQKKAEKNVELSLVLERIRYDEAHPDIIVFPEMTGFIESLPGGREEELLQRFSLEKDVMIMDSHRMYDKESHTFSLRQIGISKNTEQAYTKRLLVPAVEFIPTLMTALGNVFLDKEWSTLFSSYMGNTKGSEAAVISHHSTKVGSLICSDVFSPHLSRELVDAGANIFIVSSSHSLLGSSQNLYNQTLKFSKVRAVENNRYLVQSGNLVPSFVISNTGELLSQTKTDAHYILYVTAPLIEGRTFASYTQDGLIGLSTLFASLVFLSLKRNPQDKVVSH